MSFEMKKDQGKLGVSCLGFVTQRGEGGGSIFHL